MFLLIRHIALSLVVGALFAFAMTSKLATHHAAMTGTVAAAAMYGGFVMNRRIERREAMARAERDADEGEA